MATVVPVDAAAPVMDAPDEEPLKLNNKSREEPDLDITPMIDITFLLLIFFLVASKMDEEAAVNLPPAKTGVGVASKKSVVLIVRAAGGEKTTISAVDGTEFPLTTMEEQEENITKYVKDLMDPQKSDAKTEILIKGEADISHGEFARVAKAAGKAAPEGTPLHVAVEEKQ